MRRVLIGVVAALLVAGLMAPAASAAPIAAVRAVPKVVIIVGPAGDATMRYRAEARAAAKLARTYTNDVTELYSPDATWPAVKLALKDASLVIYMGHGNGWPSKYRDSLYPPTQNGFGLNPEAGSGDYQHQYFGEGKVATSVRLAKNAVVLLNHLCYASGLSEPGLPEGTLDQARQRVDNYAAGFIAAGAAAVVAEAYDSPDYMIRTVLGGRKSIEAAWRSAPRANGNAFGFDSTRSPGYVAEMDPEHARSGFARSIVLKHGLASSDVLRNGRGTSSVVAPTPIGSVPLEPSLLRRGVSLEAPSLAGSTLANGKVVYRIPFGAAEHDKMPDTIQASVRWDPLDPVAADPSSQTTGETADAPDFGLVTAERAGDVVAPTTVKIQKSRMILNVATPKAPGRYRLTLRLHDAEGVAYDAATQAQIPVLIVRVTGDHDAGVDAPSQLDLAPGDAHPLAVWVANLGRDAWGKKADKSTTDHTGRKVGASVTSATHAQLVGTWVALGGSADPGQAIAAAAAASVTAFDFDPAFAPGAVTRANLGLFAPSAPGEYLLVLDVVVPEVGSLTSLGAEPTVIRVHVGERAAASSAPAETPPATPAPTPAS